MAADPTSSVISTQDSTIPIPTDLGIKTAAQKQLYQTDLEFERSFVSQLMQQMDQTTQAISGSSDSTSGSSDSSSGTGDVDDSLDGSNDPSVSGYNDMITDQETQAIMAGGGLGLAAIMYKSTSAELGPDGTGTGTGAESVAQITQGIDQVQAGDSDGAQLGAATAAAGATADDNMSRESMEDKQSTSATETAMAASTPTAPTTTTATTVTPSSPTTAPATTATTTPATTTSVSPAQSHLRGFFRDPSTSTGWSFINQYGHVAQNVAAPDSHNRIVNASGEQQLGWGPGAGIRLTKGAKAAVTKAHHASSTAELRGRVSAQAAKAEQAAKAVADS